MREKESTIATSERLSHLGKTVAKTADRPALIRETLRARQPGSQRRNQRPEKEPPRPSREAEPRAWVRPLRTEDTLLHQTSE